MMKKLNVPTAPTTAETSITENSILPQLPADETAVSRYIKHTLDASSAGKQFLPDDVHTLLFGALLNHCGLMLQEMSQVGGE